MAGTPGDEIFAVFVDLFTFMGCELKGCESTELVEVKSPVRLPC